LLGRSCKVEVVVLDLEVLAERQENVEGDLVVVRIIVLLLDGESAEEQRESDREVERINGSLVENDGLVPAVYCQEMVYFGK
jgi:hypothetical protein